MVAAFSCFLYASKHTGIMHSQAITPKFKIKNLLKYNLANYLKSIHGNFLNGHTLIPL